MPNDELYSQRRTAQDGIEAIYRKSGLRLGDRVICVKEYNGCGKAVGRKGTVEFLCDNNEVAFCIIGVTFDEDIGGTDLFGTCPDGHGWLFSIGPESERFLEPIGTQERNPSDNPL